MISVSAGEGGAIVGDFVGNPSAAGQQTRMGLSFAPLGLSQLSCLPTACAVGCILSPLRGWLRRSVSRELIRRCLSLCLRESATVADYQLWIAHRVPAAVLFDAC